MKLLSYKDRYHGRDGELYVEDRAWKSKLPQAFLDAGLELGFHETDVNGINQTGTTCHLAIFNSSNTRDNSHRVCYTSSYNAFWSSMGYLLCVSEKYQ